MAYRTLITRIARDHVFYDTVGTIDKARTQCTEQALVRTGSQIVDLTFGDIQFQSAECLDRIHRKDDPFFAASLTQTL